LINPTNQRYFQASARYDLDQQQEKHGQTNQDGDTQGDLFATCTRQVEDQDAQKRQTDAWNNQVYCVEKGLTPELDLEIKVSISSHR